jgi:hypothetical protein
MTSPTSKTPAAVESETSRVQLSGGLRPDLHIDVQIHISADASTEQIEAVFASMARHLYERQPSS